MSFQISNQWRGGLEATSQGCVLWKWYIRDYLDDWGRYRYPQYIPEQCYFYLTFPIDGSELDPLQLDRVDMKRGSEYPGGSKLSPHGRFRVVAEEGDPACQFVQERPRSRTINSEESFNLARGWIETCLESHGGCEKPLRKTGLRSGFRPTRLVEIVNEKTIRLHTPNGAESVCWAALSYCWGGSQPVQTTKGTLDQLASDFPMSKLPKTLRDALITTHSHDHEDMMREIGQMPRIYKNAAVTISVAQSRSSQEGFLINVQTPSPQDDAFQLRFRGPDGILGSIIIYGQDNLEQRCDPIEDRAWTLQEHLLSPRPLIFGSRQIWWTCRNVQTNFNSGIFREYSDIGEIRLRFLNIQISQKRRAMKHIPGNTWLSLVQHYTDRQMSVTKDKLPAISGIAEYYAKKMNDVYIAGFFKKTLLPSLLWKRESPLLQRPPYRAPSWSWAAIDGTIRWELYRGITSEFLELLDFKIELESDLSPYGPIKYAQLTLRGRLKQVIWSSEGEYLIKPATSAGPGHRYLAETIPDAILEDSANGYSGFRTVWCLEICSWDLDNTDWRSTLAGVDEIMHGRKAILLKPGMPKGLVLTSNDGAIFKRVGLFAFRDPENFPMEQQQREDPAFIERVRKEKEFFFMGCEPREITIV